MPSYNLIGSTMGPLSETNIDSRRASKFKDMKNQQNRVNSGEGGDNAASVMTWA